MATKPISQGADLLSPADYQARLKKFSAEAIMADLRDQLAEPIHAAFELLVEYEGVRELGDFLGLGTTQRKNRVQQILHDWRPENPAQFLAGLQQIEAITHAPEAAELYRQFCANYGLRFAGLCRGILAQAIQIVEARRREATALEKDVLAGLGVTVSQGSAFTKGCDEALAKLRPLASGIAPTGHVIMPAAALLGGLLDDEAQRLAAEDAGLVAGVIHLGPNSLTPPPPIIPAGGAAK